MKKIIGSGFPLILSAWNEKRWIKPELIEQTELMQVKLVLHILNEGDTQSVPQDVPQGGTQGKDLDKWIEYQVAVYPKITTGELAQLSGKSIITIKRRIAKMPHIVYVGSGYSGHWEVRKKE